MKVDPDLSQKEKKRIYYENNKEAFIERNRVWKRANKEKAALSNKKSLLKMTYGLAWEDYESMFEAQDGSCAICQKPINFIGVKADHMNDACVDHCHITGKIRGLLCKNCNLGIGHFQDTIAFMEGAISYLKAHK